MSIMTMVGVRGFEPPAPASRRRCSTKLSYTPMRKRFIACACSIQFNVCVQSFHALQPSVKPRAFLADFLQACFPRNGRSMLGLTISPHRSFNSFARCAFGVVVDILRRIELSADIRKRFDILLRRESDRPERVRIGKQKPFKLMPLNIGEHPLGIRIFLLDFSSKIFLQRFD